MRPEVLRATPTKIAFGVAAFYTLLMLLMWLRAPYLQPQLGGGLDRFFLFIHNGSKWDPYNVRPFNMEIIGYDGQFFYDLARHPFHPDTLLDKPAYRSARLLYPLLVRLAALGQANLIPVMLMLINLVALGASTYILGSLFSGLKQTPLWAIGYAVWPGTICAFLYDLSEPLCFCFILIALWVQFYKPHAVWQIGLLLLLASLTKELALLFGVGWLLNYLARREWPNLAKLALVWLLPYAAWQGFLWWRMGQTGLSAGEPFSWVPFGGFVGATKYQPPLVEWLSILLATGLPLLWGSWILTRTWKRRILQLESLLASPLFFSWLTHSVFLLLLPTASYIYLVDHARNATGLLLILYLLPIADFKRLRLYLFGSSLLLSGLVIFAYANTGNAYLQIVNWGGWHF